MIRKRELAILLVALAVTMTLVGTSGVSSMTAERDVTVAVVDDSSAQFGVERTIHETDNETTVDLIVSNRFRGASSLEVTVHVDGEERDLGTLEPGESATLGALECGQSTSIEATGPGVEISLTRSLECQSTD